MNESGQALTEWVLIAAVAAACAVAVTHFWSNEESEARFRVDRAIEQGLPLLQSDRSFQ